MRGIVRFGSLCAHQQFQGLSASKGYLKNPCVRTMPESTWQVGDIGRPLEPDASGFLQLGLEEKQSWQNRKMNKNDPASTA
jgi:hypothetical protein